MGHPLFRIKKNENDQNTLKSLECDICGQKYVDLTLWEPL